MTRLEGQVALVTGAASGIGAAVARQLAQAGATVVVADVQDDKGKALAAEIGGAFAHLDVTDTGLGMTEDVQGRIFDPFFSTRPGGSGLGLPTTGKIIEAHGGRLSLANREGGGALVTVWLP